MEEPLADLAAGNLLRKRSVEAQMEQDRNSGTDQGLKEMLVLGGKTYKHFAKFFWGLYPTNKNTFREKLDQNLPFKLSAVVRATYRRLYGVTATN